MDDDLRPTSQFDPAGPDPDGAVERALEAYTSAKLTPAPAQLARMRAQLMVEATERLGSPVPLALPATRPTALTPAELTPGAIRRPATRADVLRRLGWGHGDDAVRSRGARLAPALLAASLAVLLLGGLTYASSRAGGPLYSARVWLEDATLPTEPGVRLNAELGLLRERLAEASQGASAGNGGAVRAALDAYRATVDQAVATAGGDLSLATRLELALGRHEAVLKALVGRLPANAADAIQRAIDRTEQKIQDVQNAGPGARPSATPGGDPGGGPGSTPGGGPATNPGGRPSSNPGGGPGTHPGKGPGGDAPSDHPDKSPPANGNGSGGGKPAGPDSSAPGGGTPAKSPGPDATPKPGKP